MTDGGLAPGTLVSSCFIDIKSNSECSRVIMYFFVPFLLWLSRSGNLVDGNSGATSGDETVFSMLHRWNILYSDVLSN